MLHGFGFVTEGLGFRAKGLRSRVSGLGLRVLGSRGSWGEVERQEFDFVARPLSQVMRLVGALSQVMRLKPGWLGYMHSFPSVIHTIAY